MITQIDWLKTPEHDVDTKIVDHSHKNPRDLEHVQAWTVQATAFHKAFSYQDPVINFYPL